MLYRKLTELFFRGHEVGSSSFENVANAQVEYDGALVPDLTKGNVELVHYLAYSLAHLRRACAVEQAAQSFGAQRRVGAAVPSLSPQPRALLWRADVLLTQTELQFVAHGCAACQELSVIIELIHQLMKDTNTTEIGRGALV